MFSPGLHCPASQEYQICGDSCAHSCKAISVATNCQNKCVEGCSCPAGFTLDEGSNCIPVSSCPCFRGDTQFEAGSIDFRPDTEEVCTCQNAKWHCHASTHTEKSEWATKLAPVCTGQQVLDNCPHEHQLTCSNMHHELTDHKPDVCIPRCVCAPGYVEDDTGNCILASRCPCHHGGRSYQEGDAIKQKCNTW